MAAINGILEASLETGDHVVASLEVKYALTKGSKILLSWLILFPDVRMQCVALPSRGGQDWH